MHWIYFLPSGTASLTPSYSPFKTTNISLRNQILYIPLRAKRSRGTRGEGRPPACVHSSWPRLTSPSGTVTTEGNYVSPPPNRRGSVGEVSVSQARAKRYGCSFPFFISRPCESLQCWPAISAVIRTTDPAAALLFRARRVQERSNYPTESVVPRVQFEFGFDINMAGGLIRDYLSVACRRPPIECRLTRCLGLLHS